MSIGTLCNIDGCERDASRSSNGRKGMCSTHYQRVKKYGDPYRVDKIPSPAVDWLREHVGHLGQECLKWPFHIGSDGYGRVHRPENGKLTTASNLMCEFANGPPPSSKHESAHSCGKGDKACVNPQHLYWATAERNHADKIIHGTTNRGERHGAHKLTEDDIRAIRSLGGRLSYVKIAKRFNISPSHVGDILLRNDWAWLS